MERTREMTSATLSKTDFEVEELAPGQYLKECQETWSQLTTSDKCRLASIIGIDHVLRIELRFQDN
jgi:hypothetical protein